MKNVFEAINHRTGAVDGWESPNDCQPNVKKLQAQCDKFNAEILLNLMCLNGVLNQLNRMEEIANDISTLLEDWEANKAPTLTSNPQ